MSQITWMQRTTANCALRARSGCEMIPIPSEGAGLMHPIATGLLAAGLFGSSFAAVMFFGPGNNLD
jgi:hypothetical protein